MLVGDWWAVPPASPRALNTTPHIGAPALCRAQHDSSPRALSGRHVWLALEHVVPRYGVGRPVHGCKRWDVGGFREATTYKYHVHVFDAFHATATLAIRSFVDYTRSPYRNDEHHLYRRERPRRHRPHPIDGHLNWHLLFGQAVRPWRMGPWCPEALLPRPSSVRREAFDARMAGVGFSPEGAARIRGLVLDLHEITIVYSSISHPQRPAWASYWPL